FTFIFKEDEHGLWRVHAYRYNREHSTFILETTEATWRQAGLDHADEAATAAFAERLFARELDGHRMLTNRSLWRQFPTVRTERYHGRLEPVQFAYSLLTRSLRVTHENLRTRDPKLVAAVERWFAERAAAQTGCAVMAAPPMSTPFRLRDVVLDNRLVVERAGTPGAPGLALLGSLDEPRGHGARVGLRLAGDF